MEKKTSLTDKGEEHHTHHHTTLWTMEKNIIGHEGFLFQFSDPEGYENSQGTRKKRFGLTRDHLLFYDFSFFFFFFLFWVTQAPLPPPTVLGQKLSRSSISLSLF
jgi:hypothetical protein